MRQYEVDRDTFNSIEEFQKRLSRYAWGCVVDGKYAPDDTNYWDRYKTITPKVFEKLEGGCCWDYCNYEADYFKKNFPGVKFSLYYIDSDEFDEESSTNHTWLGFEHGGKVYAFESSWKKFMGVHEFGSEKEMMDWYAKNQFRTVTKTPPHVIYRYERPSKDGLKSVEFMLYVFKTGKLLRNVGEKYEKYIEPMKDAGWKWIWDGEFYFYHLAPKDADVMKKGLLAPYALVKENPEICNKALGHYRRRMTGGWNIYPGRDPDDLTLDELLAGLNKFRGKNGDKCIYFFRYPPKKSLGPNMTEILKGKEVYRINLADPELQKHILFIDWGYVGSHTDNPQVDEKYYRTVTEKEYFKDYKDKPEPGVPPFAPIIHIGVAFRDGVCPAKFITKISSKGVTESMNEPITEGVFDIFKKKTYTDDQLLKENEKYAKMIKRDGKAYWDTHGVPIEEKIFSTSPEPTTPEMRESMVKKAIETFQGSLKKIPQKEFHNAVKTVKPSTNEIKEWVENGENLTLAHWDIWKFTKTARTDTDGDIYFWSIMQGLLNDVNINLGNRSFRVNQDGVWDDGVIYLTDRNIVTEATSVPCISTERYEPIDENVKYLDFHPDIKEVEQNVYFIQDNDGVNNAVYEIDGEKYRVRVETFVLKKAPGEPTQVFYQEQKKGNHYGTTYKIPGGSIEEGKTFAEQAESECNEEVRCKVKNVKFTGIVYTNKYDPETIPEWHKRILWPIGLKYVGAISFVYTAEYDGPYRKHVNDHDTDSLGELGDWHTLDELNKLMADVHKEIALERAGKMDSPKGLPSNVYRDKFGNLKQKGDSHYVGMMEDQDPEKWRKKIEYRMFTIRKTPQPCIMFNGGPYRARTDVLIVNSNGEILVDMEKGRGGFHYSFPGGGIDKGNGIVDCAEREAAEEARVKADVHFTGIIWYADYEDPTFNKGQFSFLCIGAYKGKDHHKIAQEDKDEFADRAKWVHWSKIGLGEPHMKALVKYLGLDELQESTGEGHRNFSQVVTESIGDMNSHDWMLHQTTSMLYRAAKELNVAEGVDISDSYNREWSEYRTEKVEVGSIHGFTDVEHKALGERLNDMFIERNGRLHKGYSIMSVPKGRYTYFYIATPSTKIPEDVKRAFKVFEIARRETPDGRRFYLVINDDYTISRHRSFRDGKAGIPPLQEAYKQALIIANSYKEFEFSYDGEFINFKPVDKETASEAYKGDDIGIAMESVDGSTLFVAMESTGKCHRDFPQVVTESNHKGWPPRTYFIEITDESVGEYKKVYSSLSHVRTGKDYHGRIIFTKMNGKTQILGFVNVRKSDGMIQALEVSPEFRGHGYADDLLGLAEYLGAKQLTVNVKNELAHKVYLKNGWKDVGVSGQMQLMRKEPLEFAMESSSDEAGKKIIPLDLKKSKIGSGSRIIAFNPHIIEAGFRGAGDVSTAALKAQFKSKEGKKAEDFTYDAGFILLKLFTDYGKKIMALDFYSVKEDQSFTTELEGCPVLACDDGKVVEVINELQPVNMFTRLKDTIGSYGNIIAIKHNNKTITLYAHLQYGSIPFKKGDKVHRGQLIGRVGHTGNCTIPHLHFETSGTTMMDYGLGRSHVGFAPFACTEIGGLTAAYKVDTFKNAFHTRMTMNTTGELSSAFFLTEPKKTMKESMEISLESAKIVEKKNLLPIRPEQYSGSGRILVMNTHITNSATQLASLPIVKYGILGSAVSALLGATAASVGFIIPTVLLSLAQLQYMRDQLLAVDFFLVGDDSRGEDIMGMDILACNDGTVIEAYDGMEDLNKQNNECPFGNHVVIEHTTGWFSAYGHMKKGSVKVTVGQKVKRGDKIGLLGSSGNSSQPHLHFEMYYDTRLGVIPKSRDNFEAYKGTRIDWTETEDSFHKKFNSKPVKISDGKLDMCLLEAMNWDASQLPTMESVTHSDAVYEFFRLYNTPWQLMNGLRKVGARWPNAEESKKLYRKSKDGVPILTVTWPEDIVRGHTAICFDYAVLEKYWADFYHFEYKMLFLFYHTANGENFQDSPSWLTGHAVGVVKFQDKWYIMDYHARRSKKVTEVIGPADNPEKLSKSYMDKLGDFVEESNARTGKTNPKIKRIYVLLDKQEVDNLFDDDYGKESHAQWTVIFQRLGYYFKDLRNIGLKNELGDVGEVMTRFFYLTDLLFSTYDKITESTEAEEPFEPIGPIEITAEAVKFAAFKRRYKDFDEFCDTMETPNDVHNWYVYNNIVWPTYKGTGSASEGSFHWPDEILKTKCGNCFDHAVFMYLFCYKKNIPATLMRVALHYREAGNNEWWPMGHAITLFKTESGWFIFNYMHPSEKSTVFGPYESKEKCAKAYAKYFDTAVRAMIDQARSFQKMEVGKIQYAIFTEAQLKDLRKLYEEKSKIGRDEWALSKQGIYFPKYETKEGGKQITLSIFDKMAEKGKDSALKAWWLVDNAVRSVLQDAQNISEYGLVPVEEATKEDSLNRPTITPVPGDIVDYVLRGLSNAGLIDLKEFSSLKSGKRFMYTRCTIMKKDVPLVIFLAYCEGLTTVLRKAHIRYEFSDVRPRLLGLDAVSRGVIPFADGYIIYDKFPLENSLLINGLAVMDTKSVEYADMDTKDVYVNLFDVLYGSRILGNALDNFYDWMIDPVTAEILEDYNYPSDFVGLLLAGNRLLADNVYEDEISMKHWRLRINEQVYAEVYKRVSDAYCRYRMTSNNKTPQKISIPRDQVTKGVSMSPIIEDASELSPVIEAKKSYTVSDKGPCGTNLDKAYTMKRRCYHESMLGVMAISTSADAMVGINRELTAEPNAINARGYVEGYDTRKMNEANLFSLVEMLTPGMITEDDPIRSAMSEKQSGHMVPVANASPVLISNGAEKVLPYRTSSDFSVVAKEDGQVVEYDQKTGVVVLKYKSGQTQLINLNTKIVKNGAGGFFLPNTMKAPKLKKGYHFKKNDVLAYNDRFFSDSSAEGTRLNVGVLAKVACTSTYINFEDGDFVTEKLSKKLSTDVCMEISAIVGKNSNVDFIVKKGQQVNIGDPLIIYDNSSDDPNFNKMLDNIGKELKQEITGMGKTPIKAKYAGVIESIQIISTVESKELSPSLRKIVEGYWNEIRAQEAKYKKYEKDMISTFAFTEKAGPVDAGEDGKVMGVKVGEGVYIRFFIKYRDNLDAGDKICLLNSLIAGRAC